MTWFAAAPKLLAVTVAAAAVVIASAGPAAAATRPANVFYGSITYYYADSSLSGSAVGSYADDACNQIDYGYRTPYYVVHYLTCSSTPR